MMSMRPGRVAGWMLLGLGLGALVAAPQPVAAQQMPDASLIHGRAIPAPELATGTVTVRVVRESIGNNVPNQTVTVTAGGATRTAATDDLGRAEFKGLPPGQEARAEATVDGEAMQSEPFMVPTSGGLRVILVSGIAQAAERRAAEAAEAATAPPVQGAVVFGGNSRVLMQFSDDLLQVYYVLDVVNSARTRVDIGGPLVIDLPPGASGGTAIEGSSPSASITADRITIAGPFAPGTTSVQMAYRLAYDSGTVAFVQRWPIAFQQVTVGVQKIGGLAIASPQFTAVREVRTENGTVFALGSGAGLAAGMPLTVTLSNLPFHSPTPRYAAIALASLILVMGVWMALRSGPAPETRSLAQRREQLLRELTQLEVRRANGAISAERFGSKRRRLVTELEQVYGELDHTAGVPEGGGEGVAA
jgi:hypothetical protein